MRSGPSLETDKSKLQETLHFLTSLWHHASNGINFSIAITFEMMR